MKKITKLLAVLLLACMALTTLAACSFGGGGGSSTTAPQEDPANATYTFNGALSVFPTNWNPLAYKTSTDGDIYDLISRGLYGYNYNADYSGFDIVPVMAAADPVDVSGQYDGEEAGWGIPEGETGRAFRIALNPDAKWEDGTPITADTYLYSFRMLLDQDLMFYRASDYYNGSYKIHNAKEFLYSGKSGRGVCTLAYQHFADADHTNLYFNVDGSAVTKFDSWLTNYTSQGYTVEFLLDYFGIGITPDELDSLNGYTLAEIEADEDLNEIWSTLIGWWKTKEDEELDFFLADYTMPVVDFANVGLKKINDYTIDIILDKELIGFYIKYTIGLPLVYQPLFDSLKKQDPTTGAWSTTSGTSAETTVSFGPYKMTYYKDDSEIDFVKNENWFGYMDKYAATYGEFQRQIDGKTVKQYQTTNIVYKKAADISTREMMFNAGQLTALGLNAELLAKYKESDYIYYAPGAATYYGIINSDFDSLREAEITANGGDENSKQYNKTILAIPEFRYALSLALNRTELCAALYPAGTAAYGLFSNLIQADPANGVSFRSLTEAKEGLCAFWGVAYGPDEEFKTLDEAYNAIVGYDPDRARELIDEAVDIAIENGWMTENTIVKLTYCASTDSETERKWYNTFNTMFTDLMVGTKLEGKFIYDADMTLGNEFGDKIQSGACDTAWGFGWSGGELDPYDLVQVYVDGTTSDEPYQYDKWIDRSKQGLTLTLPEDGRDGEAKEMTYSLLQWYKILNGLDEDLPNWSFGHADDAVRAKVLAAMEGAIMSTYTTIPMMNQGSVQLESAQVNFGREDYVFGMGFGGIRYMSYNFTDAQWAAFVAAQGGDLEDFYK
ncbi:MAG: hypothetical protein J6125_01410 [Clostridia bacterium]|nr:hypothetical protein [Clostridia bacterium]